MKIEDVEGIGPDHAGKLAGIGITSTDELLERGARPKGRAQLAFDTGISPKLILEWVNHVDLMRLDGVGSQYADLLSAAGVDSPLELARRNAGNLARTFAEIDAARPGEVRRVPSEETVAGWVEQARLLPRAVFHDDAPVPEPEAAISGTAAVGEPPGEPPVEAAAEPLAEAPGAIAEAPGAIAEPRPVAVAAEAAATAEPAPVGRPIAAAAPAAEPAPAARPIVSTPAPAARREGLWTRIKRAIGLG